MKTKTNAKAKFGIGEKVLLEAWGMKDRYHEGVVHSVTFSAEYTAKGLKVYEIVYGIRTAGRAGILYANENDIMRKEVKNGDKNKSKRKGKVQIHGKSIVGRCRRN